MFGNYPATPITSSGLGRNQILSTLPFTDKQGRVDTNQIISEEAPENFVSCQLSSLMQKHCCTPVID